jgi:hypothetical protein
VCLDDDDVLHGCLGSLNGELLVLRYICWIHLRLSLYGGGGGWSAIVLFCLGLEFMNVYKLCYC